VLFFSKRKPEAPVQIKQGAMPPIRRARQQNIKVSEDCAAIFAAIAEAHGISKAALFEDMVEERRQQLEQQGVKLNVGLS
jgi:hypothetical protein